MTAEIEQRWSRIKSFQFHCLNAIFFFLDPFFPFFSFFFLFLIQIVSRIFVFFFLKREHTLRNYFEHFERTQEEDIGTLDFRFLSFKI